MKAPLFLGLLLALGTGPTYVDNSDPLPVLLDQSELVALVRTEEIQTVTDRDLSDWDAPTSIARTVVLEAFVGDVKPGEVLEIGVHDGQLCPAPARFKVGDTYLVFLKRDDAGRWDTFAEHRSAQAVTAEQRASFALAIPKYLSIKNMPRESEEEQCAHAKRLHEWLVDLAEDPHTRWDAGMAWCLSKAIPGRNQQAAPIAAYLTDDQVSRLSHALRKRPASLEADCWLFLALAEKREPSLDPWLPSFVDRHATAGHLDVGSVLAAMDWWADNAEVHRLFRSNWSRSLRGGPWQWRNQERGHFGEKDARAEFYRAFRAALEIALRPAPGNR